MSNTYRDNYNAKTKEYRRQGYNVRERFSKKRNDGKGAGFVGCSCWHCRYGMHHSHKAEVTEKVRGNRRNVRQMLRNGQLDISKKFSVGYTD